MTGKTMPMSAMMMWVRSHVRRDWPALTLIALSIAIAGGFAMTAAIGASRSSSAWGQLVDRTNMPDVATEVLSTESGAAVDALRSRSGVAKAARLSFMLISFSASDATFGAFTGLDPGIGTDIYRPLVIRGRAADPARSDEFTINQAAAAVTGLKPGDRVTLTSFPDAVQQSATMVGIVVGPLDIGLNGDEPLVWLTPGFGATWFDTYFSALDPQLRDEYRDVVLANTTSAETTAELLRGGFISRSDFAGHQVTAALGALSAAYTVLAAVAALGTAIVTSQLIGRRVRRRGADAPTLAALGLTPTTRRIALAGSHIGSAVVGVGLVPVVAYLASPLIGHGLIKKVDPKGHHVTDATVMVIGCLVALIVLPGVAFVAAWRADARSVVQPTRPTRRLALPGPAGLFGARVASGWVRSGRATAVAHVATLAIGVATVTATLVWSGTAHHVATTPASYGANWDAVVVIADRDNAQIPLDEQMVPLEKAQANLAAIPGNASVLGRAIAGMVETEGQRVELLGIDPAAGDWWPPLLAGRVPQNDREITVGRGVIEGGVHLGDNQTLAGESFTVVGEHVTTVLSNGDFGTTVAARVDAISPDLVGVPNAFMIVRLDDGATADQLQATVGGHLEVIRPADSRPNDVDNLGSIEGLTDLLLLASILLTFGILANGLVIATGARRRDHATLRALGAQHHTIAGSVGWHATIVAALGGLLGVLLGMIAGTAVWRHTAGVTFVGDAVYHPMAIVLAVLTGVAGAGLLVAAVIGASATRHSRLRLTTE